ncbi:hypothetical protein KC332_g4608 [Hortaea werneckii]|uniref:BTB domain-containing protein n=1 Tax=Hortaea werneckii EXF-2000 TaxID=1157616 RepID=A0A1Z5TTB2_HORWE|nr:hypothetical protein KC342_g5549 [Hortaea werneckii]OTA39282.1 hypothetical protein BTJ68_00729 [Hortaea werneckii EXF-2000]KAI6839657.1 hypothetical protein KC358_g4596 [Hortaea werneckii]KAI6848930.1 hypothetical protein KC350_g2794 [Hortaea werneckii]KAI6939110.1 hypothetical protein KC341_g4414 [Hortaea werneckii]
MAPTTRRNSALLKKISTLQLKLAPLVPLPSGPPHPDFPKTLMAFHLLTEDQLDSIAHYYHQSTPGPWTHHYPAQMNWDKDFLAKHPEAAAISSSSTTAMRHSRRLSQVEKEFITDLMKTVEDLQHPVLPSQPETDSQSTRASSANPYAGLSDKERIRIKRRKVGKFIGLVGMETPAEEIAGRIQASLEAAIESSREELRRNEEHRMADTAATAALVAALESAAGDCNTTDFTIVCEGKEHQVHRFVLALHSPVLAKAANGVFKEAEEKRMDLSVDGRACVDALVKYLYTLKYTAFPSDAPPWDHAKTVEYHVRMCVMADKYDIKPLKNMAIHAFNDKIESEVAIIELSKAACIAWEATPATKEIRAAILEFGISNGLLSTRGTSKLSETMFAIPEFGLDYTKAVERRVKRYEEGALPASCENRYYCPGNSRDVCDATMILNLDRSLPRVRCAYCGVEYSVAQWEREEV